MPCLQSLPPVTMHMGLEEFKLTYLTLLPAHSKNLPQSVLAFQALMLNLHLHPLFSLPLKHLPPWVLKAQWCPSSPSTPLFSFSFTSSFPQLLSKSLNLSFLLLMFFLTVPKNTFSYLGCLIFTVKFCVSENAIFTFPIIWRCLGFFKFIQSPCIHHLLCSFHIIQSLYCYSTETFVEWQMSLVPLCLHIFASSV